jgi:hypothetical protein
VLLHRTVRLLRVGVAMSAVLLLQACGGGGANTQTPAAVDNGAPATPPSSGAYAWVLKAQGSTSSLKYGLSLLHPAQPLVEVVIEPGSAVITDAKLVQAGSVDGAGHKVDALQARDLLYIVGGDVRRVPLRANGAAPLSRVASARSLDACAFVLDGTDHATPDNSRYIVSTVGPDAQCNTADDGRAELRLTSTGGLSYKAYDSGVDLPVALLRDAATLAPGAWLMSRGVLPWASATTVPLRGAGQAAYARVLASTWHSVLVDDGSRLSVIDRPASGIATEQALDAATTGGGGWESLGHDSASYYVYRNVGAGAAIQWEMLGIDRGTSVVSRLASGAGQLSVAAMGVKQIFATVVASSGNQLLMIAKSGTTPPRVLENHAVSTLSTVQTSSAGVHELWRVGNIGTSLLNYTVEMIDEDAKVLYSSASGGFPMAVADATGLSFDNSESRDRFIFVDGFGSRAFADASLMAYDAQARRAVVLGVLPGSAAFGADLVYATVQGGGDFMTGFAARSSAGVVRDIGAKVFSFSTSGAGSLEVATSRQ